jgi:UDP-N-acetylglucosamine:LPS N-acetylglucosamine transferase
MATGVPETDVSIVTMRPDAPRRPRPELPPQPTAVLPDRTSDLQIMFVASNGGHLGQLMALQDWWSARDRSWVCIDKPDARSQLNGERTVWAHWPTTRNVPNLVKNFFLAIGTLRRERPDVLVSTGAAVAYPFFIVARLMRIPTVYIEVYDRLDSRTLTGRLCRPVSTRFLVQWPRQQELYRESVVVGPLL